MLLASIDGWLKIKGEHLAASQQHNVPDRSDLQHLLPCQIPHDMHFAPKPHFFSRNSNFRPLLQY
jgi:hypothetical protein